MTFNPPTLPTLLRICAAAQLAIGSLNLALNRLMGWQKDLERMPLLLLQVHQVHAWFVSVSLAIFAVLSWRFAPDLAARNDTVCLWLAGSIGLFWTLRTVLQVTYYSSSHWRGQTARTLIHITLLLLYGGFSLIYLTTAFGSAK